MGSVTIRIISAPCPSQANGCHNAAIEVRMLVVQPGICNADDLPAAIERKPPGTRPRANETPCAVGPKPRGNTLLDSLHLFKSRDLADHIRVFEDIDADLASRCPCNRHVMRVKPGPDRATILASVQSDVIGKHSDKSGLGRCSDFLRLYKRTGYCAALLCIVAAHTENERQGTDRSNLIQVQAGCIEAITKALFQLDPEAVELRAIRLQERAIDLDKVGHGLARIGNVIRRPGTS